MNIILFNRLMLKLTQQQLADLSGYSRRSIIRFEKMDEVPERVWLIMIEAFCKAERNQIIGQRN